MIPPEILSRRESIEAPFEVPGLSSGSGIPTGVTCRETSKKNYREVFF